MKTKILVGLLVAAALAVASGVALAGGEGADFTEAVAFMAVTFAAALGTTVLYWTDHSILGVGFVMIMTASSVIILCSVASARVLRPVLSRGL
jgi:hypothetical protein